MLHKEGHIPDTCCPKNKTGGDQLRVQRRDGRLTPDPWYSLSRFHQPILLAHISAKELSLAARDRVGRLVTYSEVVVVQLSLDGGGCGNTCDTREIGRAHV